MNKILNTKPQCIHCGFNIYWCQFPDDSGCWMHEATDGKDFYMMCLPTKKFDIVASPGKTLYFNHA